MSKQERASGGALRYVFVGALVGAALGVVQVALEVSGDAGDVAPSVARRALWLAWYGGVWSALGGALVFLVGGVLASIGRHRGWITAREGALAIVVGTAVAFVLPALALVALAPRLLAHPAIVRGPLMLMTASVGALVGWFVARRLSARPGGAIAKLARGVLAPLVSLPVAALALIGGTVRLALLHEDAATVESSVPAPATPDVLMIVVDTLRADALSCYGGSTPTPNIDALAARGTLFEDVVAPASWTRPSVASLLTSTYPLEHGCVDFGIAIAPELETLPATLRAGGYRCVGASGNPFVDPASGFAKGFDVFDIYAQEVETKLFVPRLFNALLRLTGAFDEKVRALLPWLERELPFVGTRLSYYVQDGDLNARARAYAWPTDDRPTFLYLQYVAPHTPYLDHPLGLLKEQPPLVERNLVELRARYAEEVAYVDRVIGELFEALAEERELDEMLIVLTSDHGEEFLEHGGWEHGRNLYGEVVEVPLIVAGPRIPANTRVEGRVSLLDVAPTVLDAIGFEAPSTFRGRSLVPVLNGEAPPEELAVFSETSARHLTQGKMFAAIARGRWKVIRERTTAGEPISEEVYDLATDPNERSPLAGIPAELDTLREMLDDYQELQRPPGAGETSAADREAMRALGYFDAEKADE